MAPVIWSLDLTEVNWSKFKPDQMWSNAYYLRRTKNVVYHCALVFCKVSESLGTIVLLNHINRDSRFRTHHNRDYIAAVAYNIIVGMFVSTVFGAAFFFDLFWPDRQESKAVRMAWRICGVLTTAMMLLSALILTAITATHSSYQAPLVSGHDAKAVAAMVFAWLACVSVIASCVLLFLSIRHAERYGSSKSRHLHNIEQAPVDPSLQAPTILSLQARFASPERPEMAVRELPRSYAHPVRTNATTGMPRYVFPAAESQSFQYPEHCVLETKERGKW